MTQEETTTEDLDYGPCSTTSSVPHPPNTYIGSWGQMIQSVLSLALWFHGQERGSNNNKQQQQVAVMVDAVSFSCTGTPHAEFHAHTHLPVRQHPFYYRRPR